MMAQDLTVSVELSDDLLRALGHAATRARCLPSDYLRHALSTFLGEAALCPDQAVRNALALALDWCDLQRRLRATGHVLRQVKGDLMLLTWPCEKALMPLSALGCSVQDLTLRFGTVFPKDIPRQTKRNSLGPTSIDRSRAA